MRPANRLENVCERFTWGPFDFYVHFDYDATGRCVQIALTSKKKDGTEQNVFFKRLTSLINRGLQGRL